MAIVMDHVNHIYSEKTAYEKHALKDINLTIVHLQCDKS